MSQTQGSSQKGKQRVNVRVTDAETGEERMSQDLVVSPGYCSWSSCSCTYHPPVVEQARSSP